MESTLRKNRSACRRALHALEMGSIKDAKLIANRVTWAFLFCWQLEQCKSANIPLSVAECFCNTERIKGVIKV